MSELRSLAPAIRKVLACADSLGASLPANIRKGLDNRLVIVTKVTDVDFTGPTIEQAVTAAIVAGREPAADPAVHAAVALKTIRSLNTFGTLADPAIADLFDFAVTHRDDIVKAFQPAFTTAGEKLETAHHIITGAGFAKLDNPNILTAGLTVAKANVEAREALDVLNTIRGAVGSLLVTIGGINVTPIGQTIQHIDTGNASAETIRHHGRGLASWDAITLGYTISLATPTETETRAERAYEVDAANERNHERNLVSARRGGTL